MSWNDIPPDRFAGGFSAFGLNIRVERPTGTLPLQRFNHSRPDDPEINLTVYLLGTKKMNGEPLRSARSFNDAKTLVFDFKETSAETFMRFSSESSRGTVEFVLSLQARQLWVSWSEDAPVDEVLSVLFNSVLAWVVRLTGGICLHASVVGRNGRAIAFVAPSGFGKSTIAASLIERGYAGMTDDGATLSRLDGKFLVHPGMPQLGLRIPSLDALPRFRAQRSIVTDDKRRFELTATGSESALPFENRALPLSAIYFLRRSTLTKEPEYFRQNLPTRCLL